MNTFDEIIQTKAYSDLTSSELEVIRELVASEEEYNEMKSFYAGIDQLAIAEREEVSASVKTSLNSVFQAKHPGISQNWTAPAEVEEKKTIPLYNRTLFRVAALLVLSAGAATVWFTLPENQLTDNAQMEVTASSDTPSMKQEKTQKEVTTTAKKKFPINSSEEPAREFSAASDVATDELAEQTNTVFTEKKEHTSYQWTAAEKSSTQQGFANYTAPSSPITSSFSYTNKAVLNDVAKEKGNDLTIAGIDADLNPEGFGRFYQNKQAESGISTTDLLSLIEPSF